MLKKIVLGLLVIVVVALGLFAYAFNSQRVDHTDPAYQSRVEYIWGNTIPYQPTPVERARIDTEKHVLIRAIQHFMVLPDNKPYLVAYPLLQKPLSPAVVIAPGGAYLARAEKNEGVDVAQWLNSIGVAAFVLNYRLDRHPAPLSDAQRAIQYLRANAERFHIDPTRIGMMGFSAGGHLAATAGTHYLAADAASNDAVLHFSSRPDFLLLAYPVISFGEITHSTSRDMLIGKNPPAELIDLLSNEKQVTAETPPTFIWTPKTDGVVDYRNSEVFADALKQHGVAHEFHLYPEGSHGSGLAKNEDYAKAWPEQFRAWLGKINVLDTGLSSTNK